MEKASRWQFYIHTINVIRAMARKHQNSVDRVLKRIVYVIYEALNTFLLHEYEQTQSLYRLLYAKCQNFKFKCIINFGHIKQARRYTQCIASLTVDVVNIVNFECNIKFTSYCHSLFNNFHGKPELQYTKDTQDIVGENPK